MTLLLAAVAHSVLVDANNMLQGDQPYQDVGADWLTQRNDRANTRKLVNQLERLGHIVVIDPAVCLTAEVPSGDPAPFSLPRRR
jgi:hypothetical protein